MYSANLRRGLGTPFDYFHRTTWPLVLGKLFLARMKKCGEKVARKDLTEHVANACVWRILSCLHCQEHHPQCQMEVKGEWFLLFVLRTIKR